MFADWFFFFWKIFADWFEQSNKYKGVCVKMFNTMTMHCILIFLKVATKYKWLSFAIIVAKNVLLNRRRQRQTSIW